MTEQRYKAVQAVIAEGRTVSEVASDWEVSRRTMHRWLEHYECEDLGGRGDRSHRPAHCPHQMPATIEAVVLEMRRCHAYWGPDASPSSWRARVSCRRLQSRPSIAVWSVPRSSTP